jgi:acetyl esterase/lipase
VSVVVLAAAALAPPAAGTAATPAASALAPAVTVTPADRLADGQTVRLAASGMTAGAFAVQCTAAPQDRRDCDMTTNTSPLDADGETLTGQLRVFAVIHTERGGTVDCRVAGTCVALAYSDDVEDPIRESATAPVTFDPAAGLLPAPAITVTPSTGLTDGHPIRVDARDLLHRAAQGTQEMPGVQILQCGPRPTFETCRSLGDAGTEHPQPQPDGTLTLEARVRQVIATDSGGEIDCIAGTEPCLLVATTRPGETLVAPWAAHATLEFDSRVPPAPAPEIEVTPSSDLADVTEVTVRGRNFTPGTRAAVSVCETVTPERCDAATSEQPTADVAGTFQLEMNAFAAFGVGPDEAVPVDCRTSGCVVVATDTDSLRRATVPLAFGAPAGPRGRYLDPVFADVEVDEEIVYRRATDHRGNEVDLRLDIYRPAGDTATSRPAIIWMHGGWFKGGDGGGGMPHHAEATAQRGYVAVDVGYRVRPDMDTRDHDDLYAAMVDAHEDATAAVEWVRAHAAEHGIDPAAVMAGGFSAGAVTTTNLAYMPGQLGPDTSGIAAAIPLEGWFVRPDEPGLPALGPLAIPDPGEPPAIVFHGTSDQLLPWGSPVDTCPLAAAAGIACEYVGYEGATHGQVQGRLREVMHRSTRFVVDEVLQPQGYFALAADAGGPYEVTEGSAVTLDGSAAGDGLSYAWSPGERLDDAAAPTPTYAGDDDASDALTLAVTNPHGITGTDTTEVTTTNAPPTLGDVETSVAVGQRSVTLTAVLADPGRVDTHSAEVDWGDGTVEPLALDQGSGSASVSGQHVYAAPGRHAVTVRVTDDDGGTDTWTGAVTVGCTIEGSSRADVLFGTSGDDVICAGAGSDIVLAGGGHDTVLAGEGNDLVLGGQGDDAVDGGDGNDMVLGGRGDDTCVAVERARSCGSAGPAGSAGSAVG